MGYTEGIESDGNDDKEGGGGKGGALRDMIEEN